MTSRKYVEIDAAVAERIVAMHKQHPKLGHHGLLDGLKQENIHVDPGDLVGFMRKHRIKPAREWRPWKWRGLPGWYIGRQGE